MFVLDTTTVSDYLKGNKGVRDRLRQTSSKLIYVTSITKYEVEYGLIKKPKLREAYRRQLGLLYDAIGCLEFNDDSAIVAARIKHQLFTAGTPIGLEDLMIGAIALAHEFTVVTTNAKHFSRIEGLKIEDWKS